MQYLSSASRVHNNEEHPDDNGGWQNIDGINKVIIFFDC